MDTAIVPQEFYAQILPSPKLPEEHVFIENTHFTTLLTAAYHDRERYASERSYGRIRNHGEWLTRLTWPQ
jgi:hypothetical protein